MRHLDLGLQKAIQLQETEYVIWVYHYANVIKCSVLWEFTYTNYIQSL